MLELNNNYSASSFFELEEYLKDLCIKIQLGDTFFNTVTQTSYTFKINTNNKKEWVENSSVGGGGIAKESDPIYTADKPTLALKSDLTKIVDYPTHDTLLTNSTQKEGTLGKTSSPANELFIFSNGKWHEVGNENVKVYATDAQRLGTQVIDPQIAHVVDTGKSFFWTGRVVDGGSAKWVDLGAVDLSTITTDIAALKTSDNQLAAQITNKQNKLTSEQLAILQTNPADFVTQGQLTDFQPKVLNTPLQIGGTLRTTVEGALSAIGTQTTQIGANTNAITAINAKDVLQDAAIVQLQSAQGNANVLIKFGTTLPLKTIADAKASVEATAKDGQKFDFLNVDNSHFETKLYTTDAPHWHDISSVDLTGYATTNALNTAIGGLVSNSIYNTKMTNIDNSITALTAKDAELKALIDALAPTSSDDTDWMGEITYTLGTALPAVADMTQLPVAAPTNVNKTIIVTSTNQQYMNLHSKYKGRDFYSWQAIADSSTPLQPGATLIKENWMPLLINPDFINFIKISMGDQLEPGIFRFLEGVTGRLEIGKNINTFQVNADNVNLHDSRLTTTAKDLTLAINELKTGLSNKQDNLNLGKVAKTRADGATDVIYSPLHLTSLDASGNRLTPSENYDLVDKAYVDSKGFKYYTQSDTDVANVNTFEIGSSLIGNQHYGKGAANVVVGMDAGLVNIGTDFKGQLTIGSGGANTMYIGSAMTGDQHYADSAKNVTFAQGATGNVVMNDIDFTNGGTLQTHLADGVIINSNKNSAVDRGGRVTIKEPDGSEVDLSKSLADLLKQLNVYYNVLGPDAVVIVERHIASPDITFTGLGQLDDSKYQFDLEYTVKDGSDYYSFTVPLRGFIDAGAENQKRYYGNGGKFVIIDHRQAPDTINGGFESNIQLRTTGAARITYGAILRQTLRT